MQQQLLEQTFTYNVRRTKRKTLGIYVFRDGRVEVRTPKATNRQEILNFVDSERQWVLQQLAQQKKSPPVQQMSFCEGSSHYYLGETYTLQLLHRHEQTWSANAAQLSLFPDDQRDFSDWCDFDDKNKVLSQSRKLQLHVNDPGDEILVKLALEKWYRSKAKELFLLSVDRQYAVFMDVVKAANLNPVTKPTLKIRTMKTRWGSCSSNGNINLNLWLVRLPVEVLDYVVAHELCHLIEFNHGPRFYRLLSQVVPHWQQCKQQLEQHPAAGEGF